MSERLPVWGELPPDGTVLTTAEYLQTAESLRVQELIYGTLRIEDSPHFRHQNLLLELAVLMRVFVGQHKLGTVCIAPQDVILDPARALVVQPDLMFISKSRSDIISDHIWGAPDLVVEVLSPHPRIGKRHSRCQSKPLRSRIHCRQPQRIFLLGDKSQPRVRRRAGRNAPVRLLLPQAIRGEVRKPDRQMPLR